MISSPWTPPTPPSRPPVPAENCNKEGTTAISSIVSTNSSVSISTLQDLKKTLLMRESLSPTPTPSSTKRLHKSIQSLPIKKRKLFEPPQDRKYNLFSTLSLVADAALSQLSEMETSLDQSLGQSASGFISDTPVSYQVTALSVTSPPSKPTFIYVPDTDLGRGTTEQADEGLQSPSSINRTQFLDTPLPNGCHGRTSRNHSYCRRTLCYKGSKYCKQHYMQRVRAGELFGPSNVAKPNVIVCRTALDRRYTSGLDDGEERCRATTTRGRLCAHVAVRPTHYCHMHHDYGINPPPKRGAYVKEARNTKERMPSRVSRTNKLLSSFCIDQWRGCRVRILGDNSFAGSCGLVKKWHNGWVCVQMDGNLGLQNRRSFELEVIELRKITPTLPSNTIASESSVVSVVSK